MAKRAQEQESFLKRNNNATGKVHTKAHYYHDQKNAQTVVIEQEYPRLFKVYLVPDGKEVECSSVRTHLKGHDFPLKDLRGIVEKANGNKFAIFEVGKAKAEIKTRCLGKFLESCCDSTK